MNDAHFVALLQNLTLESRQLPSHPFFNHIFLLTMSIPDPELFVHRNKETWGLMPSTVAQCLRWGSQEPRKGKWSPIQKVAEADLGTYPTAAAVLWLGASIQAVLENTHFCFSLGVLLGCFNIILCLINVPRCLLRKRHFVPAWHMGLASWRKSYPRANLLPFKLIAASSSVWFPSWLLS